MIRGNKQNFISRFLFQVYTVKNAAIKDAVIRTVCKLEGGEFHSKTLRAIFSEYHDIHIGMYSYGCFSPENIPAGTLIGRYCSFARGILILNGSHPVTFKSTHPFFYNPSLGYVDKLLIERTKIIIGNDVWVGANATILPSVSQISDGAVIGAGSVVTKNVPPFAIVAGNPSKIAKYRFKEETIQKIIKSGWWHRDIESIKGNPLEFVEFTRTCDGHEREERE